MMSSYITLSPHNLQLSLAKVELLMTKLVKFFSLAKNASVQDLDYEKKKHTFAVGTLRA